jgi:hypothetical protein
VVVFGVLVGCLVVLLWASPTAAIDTAAGSAGTAGAAPATGAQTNGAEPGPSEAASVTAATGDATANCDGEPTGTESVPDGTHTAVLDRIEDDLAVLEVSDGAGDTHELVVDVTALPTDGRHPNAVFEVRTADGELRNATYDESQSEARLEDAQDRFDGLASGSEGDDEEEEADEEE